MKALIVSRTEGARAWLRSALGAGAEAREAANGLEALRIAGDERFDLVVADESTEPYGAFGLVRELKLLEDPPATIVILDRAQDTWLAKWSGTDAWLMQPVDPFALAALARDVVARAGSGAAHTEANAPAD